MKFVLFIALTICTMALSIVAQSRTDDREESQANLKFMKKSFSWMTTEQKQEMEDEVLKVAYQTAADIYENIEDRRVKEKAQGSLQNFCKETMTRYLSNADLRKLTALKNQQVPKEELFAAFNEMVSELSESDQRAIRQPAHFCRLIMHLDTEQAVLH